MTIAELFINIGVKGGDKTKEALKGTKSGLEGIQKTAIETKVAILAALYALEKLMAGSVNTGMELTKFSNFTGLSADTLQRWQVVARQSGVAAEDMMNSVKGVQSAMAQMQLGKGPPGGIGVIAQYTGGFDEKKINDVFYMMDKLKQFAQNKEVPAQFRNEFLKSFNLSDDVIQMLATTKMKLSAVNKSQIYGSGEINQLNQTKVAWENLGAKIEMAIGHLTSKHGLKLTQDISKAADAVFKLVDALVTMAEKLHAFEHLSEIIHDLAYMAGLISNIAGAKEGTLFGESHAEKYLTGGKKIDLLGEKHAEKKIWNWVTSLAKTEPGKTKSGEYRLGDQLSKVKPVWQNIAPKAPHLPQKAGAKQTNHISTTVVNHGVKDAQHSADLVDKHVKRTFKQIPVHQVN